VRPAFALFPLLACADLASAQDRPQPLPTVPVTASTELVRNAKLREFDRRRSNGIGRFLSEADLEKDQYRKLSDVLRKLPGITFSRAKGTPGVNPLAEFAVSSRGSATITNVSPIFGKNCPIAIWLDGVPVYRGLDRNGSRGAFGGDTPPVPAQIGEPPFDINSIMTQHIAAIEFYAGPATMPPEFNATQGTCGALVIWTK
jgi:hypothetical protein